MTTRGSNDFGVGGQPQQALFCQTLQIVLTSEHSHTYNIFILANVALTYRITNRCLRASIAAAASSYNITQSRTRSNSNTMQRECKTSSKLHYIYLNKTLILQRGNAPCFAALMQPAMSSDSYVLVTSLLQRLLARMYGLSTNSHTCHTRQRQQLHI